MAKKYLILMGFCGCAVSIVFVVLYAGSPLSREAYRGEFERKFLMKPAYFDSLTWTLPNDSYHIAGVVEDKVYLLSSKRASHLLIADIRSLNIGYVDLPGADSLRIASYPDVKIKVDSSYFFLMSGVMPGIVRGDIEDWQVDYTAPDSAYFVDAVPIGRRSFVLRSYSTMNRSFELGKLQGESPVFTFNVDLLEKQVDGLFCVTGMLHYAKELNRLVYLYSYRNEYIVFDTSLNLDYRANTIDGFTRARIKVVEDEKSGTSRIASPPTITNGLSSCDGGYLFVNSRVLSRGEDWRGFAKNSVFDVYALKTGTYSGSFYVANHKEYVMKEFTVFEDHLAALFDRYLVVYLLQPGLLE